MKRIVVGASLAGLHSAQALRRRGHTGEIIVLGDEPHMPYDRRPLSKQLLETTMDRSSSTSRSTQASTRHGCWAAAPLDWTSRGGRSGSPTAHRSPTTGSSSPPGPGLAPGPGLRPRDS